MIWFKFYSAWGDGINELTDEEAGHFIKAVCKYAETGEVEQLSGIERVLFAMVLKQMKQDAEHAESVSSARAKSGRMGGLVSSGSKQNKQMLPIATNCLQNEANDSKSEQNEANALIKNKELRIKNSELRTKNEDNTRSKNSVKHKRGQFQHVLLTDEEYGKLVDQFPEDFRMRIQNLDNYLENNRKKHYDNHYLTILNWARKDNAQQKPVRQKQESWIEVANRLAQEVNA